MVQTRRSRFRSAMLLNLARLQGGVKRVHVPEMAVSPPWAPDRRKWGSETGRISRQEGGSGWGRAQLPPPPVAQVNAAVSSVWHESACSGINAVPHSTSGAELMQSAKSRICGSHSAGAIAMS